MNVDSLQLSEFATYGSGNRLSVINVFNQLLGSGPRWGVPMLYLSWIIHAHRDEAGQHDGEIRLVNAARESLLPKPIRFSFQLTLRDDTPGMPLRHTGMWTFGGLVFTAPGPYAFELYIDDIYGAATTLYISKTEPKAG